MICTEQERAALERILAVLKPILTDHNPPIAIDWVGKGAIAVGQEFESAINAVREHKDDAAIRAMLAPDPDAVVIPRALAERVADAIDPNLECHPDWYTAEERQRIADAAEIRAVLRGEATRDE